MTKEFKPGWLYSAKYLPKPNPDPVEVFANIPRIKNENRYRSGWVVGWVQDQYFCTPGSAYSVSDVWEWTPIPEAPEVS